MRTESDLSQDLIAKICFSDLRGTAVKYLDLSYHPAKIIHSDRTRVSLKNFLMEKNGIIIKIF